MIYFVRHGQSQAQVDERYSEESSPLTDLGKAQAVAEGKRMHDQHIHIDRIITSPLPRARQTAELIAKEIGIDVDSIIVDERLTEYDLGSVVGKLFSEVPKVRRVHKKGAENPEAFRARVKQALEAASHMSGNTLLVSHTGVGRIIEAIRTSYDPWKFYDLEGTPNARAVQLDLK